MSPRGRVRPPYGIPAHPYFLPERVKTELRLNDEWYSGEKQRIEVEYVSKGKDVICAYLASLDNEYYVRRKLLLDSLAPEEKSLVWENLRIRYIDEKQKVEAMYSDDVKTMNDWLYKLEELYQMRKQDYSYLGAFG